MRLKIMFSHISVALMGLAALAGVVILIVHAPLWAWLLVPGWHSRPNAQRI